MTATAIVRKRDGKWINNSTHQSLPLKRIPHLSRDPHNKLHVGKNFLFQDPLQKLASLCLHTVLTIRILCTKGSGDRTLLLEAGNSSVVCLIVCFVFVLFVLFFFFSKCEIIILV